MSERRPHQCQRDGCHSQATAWVKMYINLPSPGQATKVIDLKLSMEVCDKHQDDVRAYVLSEENKKTIYTQIMDAGLPEPDFLSARIVFVPIPTDHVNLIVGCDREGCANPAKWQIKQIIPEIGRKGKPRLEAMTNMCVCDKHKRETKPADLLDDDSRKRTLAWLNAKGVLLPDLERMTIEFVPLAAGQRAVAI